MSNSPTIPPLHAVQSNNISGIGHAYDYLYVKFKDESLWRYSGVPMSEFLILKGGGPDGKSVGSYFQGVIKKKYGPGSCVQGRGASSVTDARFPLPGQSIEASPEEASLLAQISRQKAAIEAGYLDKRPALTPRQHLAGMVMQGLICAAWDEYLKDPHVFDAERQRATIDYYADLSIAIADAIMARTDTRLSTATERRADTGTLLNAG